MENVDFFTKILSNGDSLSQGVQKRTFYACEDQIIVKTNIQALIPE